MEENETATEMAPTEQTSLSGAGNGAKAVPTEGAPDRPSRAEAECVSEEVPINADDLATEALHEQEFPEKTDAVDSSSLTVRGSGAEEPAGGRELEPQASQPEPIYSVIPRPLKIQINTLVAIAGILSPLTGSIYLPALNSIAEDLKVRTSLVNLSITTYQIVQGIAPSFIGTLSDVKGRRPAYIVTISIYLVANLALALQHSYPALMVLRCLQSAGSSATIALGSATVSDMITRAERGSWLGYTTLGISLGPALGPVIGGLLNHYRGWHSIFWFLLIFSAVVMILMILILPETGRAVVGNNTIRPPRWNLSVLQLWRLKRGKPLNGNTVHDEDKSTIVKPKKRPSPLSSLLILREKEGGITLSFGAIFFAGYFMVLTTLSEQLHDRFGFSSAITGACYLPLGFGSLLSRFCAGQLFDCNFRRYARKLGISLDVSKQQKIEVFPIEKIRLEVCIPLVYISCGTVLAYAWAMNSQSSLAGILVSLFFLGLFFSGAQQGFNTLVVDTHSDIPATATAANNLVRCLLSAAAVAVAPHMIEKIGIGFTGVFISGVWLLFSPLLWLVMIRGKKWREDDRAKEQREDAEKARAPGLTV